MVFSGEEKIQKIGFLGVMLNNTLCFLKLVFKKLCKNLGREIGTLRFFSEKLQHRNVTQDIEHYEDFEQLFMSAGKCFTIEVLVKFFNMANKDGNPTNNRPPLFNILMTGNNKQGYITIQYWINLLTSFFFCTQPHSQAPLSRRRGP